MAYNLEPRTIKENLLGLIGNNPYAEPRPAKTREECFLSDIAENGGGGGSSLPPYTAADKGKGLFLAEDAEHPVTKEIIPYQSGEVIDLSSFFGAGVGFAPIGIDNTYLHNVDTITLVIGEKGGQQSTLNMSKGTYSGITGFFSSYTGIALYEDEETHLATWYYVSLYGGEAGDTVYIESTASVPSVAPAWVSGGALIVKATGEATYSDGTITVGADISVADFAAVIESSTFTPIYVFFPRMGPSIQGYYDYEYGPVAIYSTLNLIDINIAKFDDPNNNSYFYAFGFNGDASALVFTYDAR